MNDNKQEKPSSGDGCDKQTGSTARVEYFHSRHGTVALTERAEAEPSDNAAAGVKGLIRGGIPQALCQLLQCMRAKKRDEPERER